MFVFRVSATSDRTKDRHPVFLCHHDEGLLRQPQSKQIIMLSLNPLAHRGIRNLQLFLYHVKV